MQCITVPAVGRGILRQIRVPVAVRQAFDPKLDESKRPTACSGAAIWDTGATGSVITQHIVDSCGLKPVGMTMVSGVHSAERSPVYLVNIELPNVGFADISVTLGKLPKGTDVLIGMDIITRGDMAITNHGGHTYFTFRCPSHSKIDFVAEVRAAKGIKAKGQTVHPVGRNSPCPCGSGKKYKRCHGEGKG